MEKQWNLVGGGSLRYREEGGRVSFEARHADDKKGLYKLHVLGKSGTLDLGALLPEQNLLRLRRVVSMEKLLAEGCWPVTGAEILLAVPFESEEGDTGWVPEEAPANLLRGDKLLERSASEQNEALIKRGEGYYLLAFPYREDGPFALTPLFCFACILQIDGKYYTVYRFLDNGMPQLQNENPCLNTNLEFGK